MTGRGNISPKFYIRIAVMMLTYFSKLTQLCFSNQMIVTKPNGSFHHFWLRFIVFKIIFKNIFFNFQCLLIYLPIGKKEKMVFFLSKSLRS